LYYKGKKVKGPMTKGTDFHGYGEKIREEVGRRIPKGKLRVLDVGTGFGSNVTFLTRQLPKGSGIWTIDPSQEALDNAKARLGQDDSGVKVEFVQANAEKLDFEDSFFDLAVTVMVFHHVKDIRVALKEIFRVLKKKGRLLVADYTPEASHKLHFQSRHLEADFFKTSVVEGAIKENAATVKMKDFGVWYFAEGNK
jgi:ubiquinone/menaquinone biosynthesis C-methylase UbiE